MPLGNPEFTYGDNVMFTITAQNGDVLGIEGTVEIVDSHGIFGDNTQVYYDIMVDPDPRCGGQACLYKHIPEDDVHPAAG